eukprot:2470381-Amphidinium_carterae.1
MSVGFCFVVLSSLHEACAGLGGVCKLLGVLALEAQPANVHLHCLNPHIDDSGFPGIWPTELTDVGLCHIP